MCPYTPEHEIKIKKKDDYVTDFSKLRGLEKDGLDALKEAFPIRVLRDVWWSDKILYTEEYEQKVAENCGRPQLLKDKTKIKTESGKEMTFTELQQLEHTKLKAAFPIEVQRVRPGPEDRFRGKIKSLGKRGQHAECEQGEEPKDEPHKLTAGTKGYGFIECKETECFAKRDRAWHDGRKDKDLRKDVLVDVELECDDKNISVGEEVTFEIFLSRRANEPRAKNLRKIV